MPAGREPARATVYGDAFPVTSLPLPRFGNTIEIKDQVVGYEKIEVTVTVEIEKGTARAPAVAVAEKPRILRHICERAVTVITVQHVPPPVSHEQIFIAVIVKVTDADG